MSVSTAPSPRRMRLRRRSGLTLRIVDGEGFLLDARHRRIHHLNPTALAVWTLLGEPQTVRGIVAAFELAFPGTPVEHIRSDIKTLASRLLKEDLTERCAS